MDIYPSVLPSAWNSIIAPSSGVLLILAGVPLAWTSKVYVVPMLLLFEIPCVPLFAILNLSTKLPD